jgi:hypothetical protein
VSVFKKFITSKEGQLATYESRRARRLRVSIYDIEPQSKKMNAADRDRFQSAVAQQLTEAKRSTFRGPVGLNMDLATTAKNPPHAHTIAKNLLDLLSARREGIKFPRKHLLYEDDKQIEALSVSCRHGENQPLIHIEARPFSDMLADLEIGAEATRDAEMNLAAAYSDERDMEWVDSLRKLVNEEEESRERLGDSLYESYLKMTRWSAQSALLRRSGVKIPVLGWMYGIPKDRLGGFHKRMWAELIGQSKLRLQIGELPITSGESDSFEQTIAAEIRAFKARWNWILNPLVIAVGLEVIIRPNPATPTAVLHDLDNVVRDYLIPQIVPAFGTLSDLRWTIDFDELKRTDPRMAASWRTSPTPPAGTRLGVTRYEAWRLPPDPREKGFVSVALIADMDAKGDLMDQLDATVATWRGEKRRR